MVCKKIAISYELKKFNQPALFLSRDPFLKFQSKFDLKNKIKVCVKK